MPIFLRHGGGVGLSSIASGEDFLTSQAWLPQTLALMSNHAYVAKVMPPRLRRTGDSHARIEIEGRDYLGDTRTPSERLAMLPVRRVVLAKLTDLIATNRASVVRMASGARRVFRKQSTRTNLRCGVD